MGTFNLISDKDKNSTIPAVGFTAAYLKLLAEKRK
jgi:hypothetical protein